MFQLSQSVLYNVQFIAITVGNIFGNKKNQHGSSTGHPKMIVLCLFGYCGEAVDSIILVFTQLQRSGFNFETLFELI